MPNKTTLISALFFSLIFSLPVYSENSSQLMQQLLSEKTAPAGVVFEIATGANNSLQLALPAVKKHIKKLRQKFPGITIAIVTHGKEQFALKSSNTNKYKKVHDLTQQLAKDENIDLHVCGTYASWNNVSAEEFPEYVDVTAAGPATINDYIALGYRLIKL